MSTQEHFYFSRVLREETIGPDEEILPISFCLVEQTRCWYDDVKDVQCKTFPEKRSSFSMPFSHRHHFGVYTEPMHRELSTMGVPREEQPTILGKLFHMVDAAVPGDDIFVLIADVTVSLLGSFSDHGRIADLIRGRPNICIQVNEMICQSYTICGEDYHDITTTDRIALESFEAYEIKFIPTTTSSIEGLPRVRLDSLEEATIKHNPSCSICKDGFAQGGADRLITYLPCTHLYHVDCVNQWLQTSHVCPLCRYPLPNVEDGTPSSS